MPSKYKSYTTKELARSIELAQRALKNNVEDLVTLASLEPTPTRMNHIIKRANQLKYVASKILNIQSDIEYRRIAEEMKAEGII